MRAGKHYAEYQTTRQNCIFWDYSSSRVFFKLGIINWHKENWEGMEMVGDDEAAGTRIGLLLDFDNGTLAVYKNDRRFRVKGGLSGEWQWYVHAMFELI
ncbi:hypothetical protein ACHAXR_005295 [Thalassiosira sp. AJA248-18]